MIFFTGQPAMWPNGSMAVQIGTFYWGVAEMTPCWGREMIL
jgi:hypothetical protein